jgi:hypothetical protein
MRHSSSVAFQSDWLWCILETLGRHYLQPIPAAQAGDRPNSHNTVEDALQAAVTNFVKHITPELIVMLKSVQYFANDVLLL